MELEKVLDTAIESVDNVLDLKIEKSKIKLYDGNSWKYFCQVNGFDVESEGLYIPQYYAAYTREDSPYLISNVFHELFGHGLFCEHSSLGKELVSKCDKRIGNEYLFDRSTKGITNYNITNYEGFALWMESMLCENVGCYDIWEKKKLNLSSNDIKLHDYFKYVEMKIGILGMMVEMGFEV